MVHVMPDPIDPSQSVICIGDQPVATFPNIGKYITLKDLETIVNNAVTAWERSWH